MPVYKNMEFIPPLRTFAKIAMECAAGADICWWLLGFPLPTQELLKCPMQQNGPNVYIQAWEKSQALCCGETEDSLRGVLSKREFICAFHSNALGSDDFEGELHNYMDRSKGQQERKTTILLWLRPEADKGMWYLNGKLMVSPLKHGRRVRK